MGSVARLEQFWRNLVLTSPLAKDVNGAVVAYYPEVPILVLNHAADINVDEDEAENLLNRVTNYFLSRGFPFACFRISPLTRPRSFTSLLEDHDFERKAEESVMVFKGKHVEDKLNPKVKVEEISESEISVCTKLFLTIFEMPIEWKRGGIDSLLNGCEKDGNATWLTLRGNL